MIDLRTGNCLDVMPTLEANSIDTIITDPPYGISFMGKRWDYDVPAVDIWREVYRVLKPGAHILVACGTRTQHRMAVNIEDAGFEIRDVITWLYGSGFPKSHDISKAIDKEAGCFVEGALSPNTRAGVVGDENGYDHSKRITLANPQTPAALYWQGWGTALKPACEFWTLARKPISERTVAANVLEWGTGGINVDGCRIASEMYKINTWDDGSKPFGGGAGHDYTGRTTSGRFPANLILDEDAAALLDEQSGVSRSTAQVRHNNVGWGTNGIYGSGDAQDSNGYSDTGGASRFFYVAKASRAERDAGCEGLPECIPSVAQAGDVNNKGQTGCPYSTTSPTPKRNAHPTVKPISLMRYLCRLITPPAGVVLDPFMGSGSTGCAAVLEGRDFIGIELDEKWVDVARRRIAYWQAQVVPETLPLEMAVMAQ